MRAFGQVLALETNITAEPISSRAIQPETYVERTPSDAPPGIAGALWGLGGVSRHVAGRGTRVDAAGGAGLAGLARHPGEPLPEDAPDEVLRGADRWVVSIFLRMQMGRCGYLGMPRSRPVG